MIKPASSCDVFRCCCSIAMPRVTSVGVANSPVNSRMLEEQLEITLCITLSTDISNNLTFARGAC